VTGYDWPQATRDCCFYLAVMGSVVGTAQAVAAICLAVISRIANAR
jgi:hypothetical protein